MSRLSFARLSRALARSTMSLIALMADSRHRAFLPKSDPLDALCAPSFLALALCNSVSRTPPKVRRVQAAGRPNAARWFANAIGLILRFQEFLLPCLRWSAEGCATTRRQKSSAPNQTRL